MNGSLVPPEILMLDPWWRNFFWNMATVQFDHRLIAWLLALFVPVLWWKARAVPGLSSRARSGATLLLALLALQIALGISTLLLAVPVVAGRRASGGRGARFRGGVQRRARLALAPPTSDRGCAKCRGRGS